jgi:hypothetical protein
MSATQTIYPLFVELPAEHLSNAVRKQIVENMKDAYGVRVLGVDRTRIWLYFHSGREREVAKATIKATFELALGLKTQDVLAPSRSLQIKEDGHRLRLK